MTADAYDYVIVGAGSAGCVLANRLSADGKHSVLLLEAGAVDKKTEIRIPAAFSTLFRSEADWNYDTVPQEQLDSRSVYWPRGKVLGGSSSINAMMWVRGFAADYDSWAELAGPQWSWKALLPHFKAVERITGSDDPAHGTAGEMAIIGAAESTVIHSCVPGGSTANSGSRSSRRTPRSRTASARPWSPNAAAGG